MKDVLQVLKASKADKEALEGGDINSILFASAGSGGGGSGGGAGLSKSSSSGVDLGGNCEVTFKSKARLKSVLKLDVEMSTSVWEVINFISNRWIATHDSNPLYFSALYLAMTVATPRAQLFPLSLYAHFSLSVKFMNIIL